MSVKTPRVMLSSTYFDLKQVRADLTKFLGDEMGYVPVVSELDSFPIDPHSDAVENCRRRVEDEADILVLVIGARYGYVDKSSEKSITNVEYLAARAKGIPVFAFVESGLLPLVPLWKANPEADFSSNVDDPRVLGFVDQVRSIDKVWTREFSKAEEISSGLRNSFANLTVEALHWTRKLRDISADREVLERLRGRSLRLALERPHSWGVRLLFEETNRAIDRYRDARNDHRLGILLGGSDHIAMDTFDAWFQKKKREILSIVDAFNRLFDGPIQEATGINADAPDPAKILYVAERIGRAYAALLNWWNSVQAASCEEALEGLRDAVAKWPNRLLTNLEGWAQDGRRAVEEAVERGVDARVDLTLTMEMEDDGAAAMEELRKLEDRFGV